MSKAIPQWGGRSFRVSFRKLSLGGGGGQLEESGFLSGGVWGKAGMMVKDVTKFHKSHLGGRGLEYA